MLTKNILCRCALSSLISTFLVWATWALTQPIAWRIAKIALIRWTLPATAGMCLLLAVAWALHAVLRLNPVLFPALTGAIVGMTAGTMQLLAGVVSPIPTSELVLTAMGSAWLAWPDTWRRLR